MPWNPIRCKSKQTRPGSYQRIPDFETAELIRARLKAGEHRAVIAEEFKISKREVANIEKYRTWKRPKKTPPQRGHKVVLNHD